MSPTHSVTREAGTTERQDNSKDLWEWNSQTEISDKADIHARQGPSPSWMDSNSEKVYLWQQIGSGQAAGPLGGHHTD